MQEQKRNFAFYYSMVIEDGEPERDAGATNKGDLQMREEKKAVRDFYDHCGWETVDGVFIDSLKFVDLRQVNQGYYYRINQRTRAYLNPTGRFILDAASGAIADPQHSIYSEGYDYRICLDFSLSALRGARKKLETKGIYILGDITNLPFTDNSIDSVMSFHTLYHVPADEQKIALLEIYRVLRPGGRAVIVYSWGSNSLLMKLFSPNNRVNRAIVDSVAFLTRQRKKRGKRDWPDQIPNLQPELKENLYFHVHPYSWFKRELKPLTPFKLACWKSIDTEFQKTYIHDWFYGKQILTIIAWLEGKFPWILGRLGQYPMFIIHKEV